MSGLERAQQGLIVVATGCVVLLLTTGVALSQLYRPTEPWADVTDVESTMVDVLHAVHVVATWALLVVGVLLLVVLAARSARGDLGDPGNLAERVRSRRLPTGFWLGVGVLAVAVFGGLTGTLVGWDRLALGDAELADSWQGVVEPMLSSQVRHLVVDGRAVSQGDYRLWTGLHIAVPLAATALVAAWRRLVP